MLAASLSSCTLSTQNKYEELINRSTYLHCVADSVRKTDIPYNTPKPPTEEIDPSTVPPFSIYLSPDRGEGRIGSYPAKLGIYPNYLDLEYDKADLESGRGGGTWIEHRIRFVVLKKDYSTSQRFRVEMVPATIMTATSMKHEYHVIEGYCSKVV